MREQQEEKEKDGFLSIVLSSRLSDPYIGSGKCTNNLYRPYEMYIVPSIRENRVRRGFYVRRNGPLARPQP